MDLNERTELIDKLHEKPSFCFDIFPQKVESERYFEIEEFLIEKYLEQYAENISLIIIQLYGYYELEIYLTELIGKTEEFSELRGLVWKNLANIKLEKLCELIKTIICNDIASLEILVPKYEFEISIGGLFNTAVFNIHGEHRELLKKLVESKQLYFRNV